jgi:alpha-L-rhamnosidase
MTALLSRYTVSVTAEDICGEKASASMEFETGKLAEPWLAKWISHGSCVFRERRVSPRPLRFRKRFSAGKELQSAKLYCTALGLYVCSLNGKRVGEDSFTPRLHLLPSSDPVPDL